MPRKPNVKRSNLENYVCELRSKYPDVKFELSERIIDGKPDFFLEFIAPLSDKTPDGLFVDLYRLTNSYHNVGFGGGWS